MSYAVYARLTVKILRICTHLISSSLILCFKRTRFGPVHFVYSFNSAISCLMFALAVSSSRSKIHCTEYICGICKNVSKICFKVSKQKMSA